MHGLILHEDEHLLVVNKPPGWNTHSPSPYAGEGVYDWLRHREPRWASLAIIHRLDKETSGVLVFSKTPLANRVLTGQFARREVRKEYRLITGRPVRFSRLNVKTGLARAGARYVVRPVSNESDSAETRFETLEVEARGTQIRAIPLTGRTHQIRVHAAARGFPVLGDILYGGEPATRLHLHAERVVLRHPASNEPMEFQAPADFSTEPWRLLRDAIVEPSATEAWRMVHGASDPVLEIASSADSSDWTVDRLGPYLLAQSSRMPGLDQREFLRREVECARLAGAYHKTLSRHLRGGSQSAASPKLVLGEPAPERFVVRENGLRFELSFGEGYSLGLFLDQRDNRRRLLVNHVAAGFPAFPAGATGAEVLNVFAYTCAFSICAARAGARTLSLDLSRKYLEWGRRNFVHNALDPASHDFLYGEAFDWLRRLAKKGRQFDAVLVDPPTFSTSKQSGVFRAEADYARLVSSALPLVKPAGLLFCSTNAAGLAPERFLEQVNSAIAKAGRRISQEHYAPQPPDFPISRDEPAYLKTVWLRLE